MNIQTPAEARIVCAEHDVVLEVCGCDLIAVDTTQPIDLTVVAA